MKAMEALVRLEQAVEARLSALREGVQPLLAEAREHLSVLEPPPGGQLPSPAEQQQRQEKLAQVLDQAEDVLEALYLAARAGRREGRG
jgi:hypothetical protein